MPSPPLVLCADAGVLGVVGLHGEPLLERAPVQALVAVPVVLGGRDHAGQSQAGGREALDGRLEVDVAVVVRALGQRPAAPVGLADGDVAARRRGGRECAAASPMWPQTKAAPRQSTASQPASTSTTSRASPCRTSISCCSPAALAPTRARATNSSSSSRHATWHRKPRARMRAGPPAPDARSSTRLPARGAGGRRAAGSCPGWSGSAARDRARRPPTASRGMP